MKKKIIATTFVAALLSAGGVGVASASTTLPPPPNPKITETFHCNFHHHPVTFKVKADKWVMGQLNWYYGRLGCTHTP